MSTNIFEQSIMNPTFIFVDGSYYNFYRYYALMNWWKITLPEEPLDDPIKNGKFVEKFKKTFINNLKEIPKKLKLSKEVNPILIVGKDCNREDIWRTELCKNSELFKGDYKGNRKNGPEDGFMGGPLFKMAYEEELFQQGGVKAILKHPRLEADDCIAISVKFILEKYPQSKIYIITSDKDYLQLAEERVELYSLAFKKLTDQKSCLKDAKCDLFCKIVMGDPSDNIKSVLKSCGPKTALKCYENPEYFEERLKKENAYELYNLNKKLVDFNEIPSNLVDEFINNTIKR
jgi:5'-3' exonuclease